MLKNKLKIYQFIYFLPSIFLLLILNFIFKTFVKKYKKIISLRINKKYLGHFSIEPAIFSSYLKEKKRIIPLVSFKKAKGIDHKILEEIARNSFKIKKDLFNSLLEKIYNYSFENIRLKINNYYSPLIHRKLETREISYMYLLDSDRFFKWRDNAKKLIFKNNEKDFKLVIALRTEYFNKELKDVPSQPWRNASIEDLVYICNLFCKVVDPKRIYLLFHPRNIKLLEKIDFINTKINLIDETKIDVISLFSENTYLVNNGNGIGAAALSIGIRTLYIHHTAWHFWHTSHSNALCLPSKFFTLDENKKKELENIIGLAFSPKSLMPLDFQKDYYQNSIYINRIQDIQEEVLIKTLEQFLNIKEKVSRKKASIMGCQFEYGSLKEKKFWTSYIRNMPCQLREGHKLIKLKISNSFLESF